MQAARQERRARQDALSVPALALCSRRQSARLGPGRRRAAAPAGRWRQGRGVGALHERGAAGRVGRCAVAQQVRRKAQPGRAVVVSHEVPCETLVVAAAGHRLQPLVGVVHFHPPWRRSPARLTHEPSSVHELGCRQFRWCAALFCTCRELAATFVQDGLEALHQLVMKADRVSPDTCHLSREARSEDIMRPVQTASRAVKHGRCHSTALCRCAVDQVVQTRIQAGMGWWCCGRRPAAPRAASA